MPLEGAATHIYRVGFADMQMPVDACCTLGLEDAVVKVLCLLMNSKTLRLFGF